MISRTSLGLQLQKQLLLFLLIFLFVTGQPSHAADYNENVIPQMTSNTTPSGIAFSNTQYNSDYQAWRAFDRMNHENPDDNRGKGGAQSTNHNNLATNPWMIGYEFPTNYVIVKYTITSPNWNAGLTQMAKDWTFEGWNGSEWEVLHTVTNESDWTIMEKRTYSIENPKSYKKYQIRVTANHGYYGYVYIDEIEMMGYPADQTPPLDTPVLSGSTENKINYLTWEPVEGASGYHLKRATTAGGPYTTIATLGESDYSYEDTDVSSGTTYYYVVTAVIDSRESEPSNEIALTPLDDNTTPPPTGNRALLIIRLISGLEKEYDLPMSELEKFIKWYEDRADGIGNETYIFHKTFNLGPFESRKDYVAFSMIQLFEVMEYE